MQHVRDEAKVCLLKQLNIIFPCKIYLIGFGTYILKTRANNNFAGIKLT